MKEKWVINFRVDERLKNGAKEVFDMMSLPMNVAVAMFFRQCLVHEGLPFEIELWGEV